MHLCSYTNSLKVLVKQGDQLILFQISNVSSTIIIKVLLQVFFNQLQIIKKWLTHIMLTILAIFVLLGTARCKCNTITVV